MIFGLTRRFLTEPDPRVLRQFVFNFGLNGMKAVKRFERQKKRGPAFPAFLFISVTDQCNLRCRGCWVTPSTPPRDLNPDLLRKIIRECNEQGSRFFGILGGEPFLYEGLLDILAEFPKSYFLVFTNGTLITNEMAARMRRMANISPLISVEGSEPVSDERRGGTDVLARTYEGLRYCTENRLIVGAATSVCKSNMADLATDAFLQELIERGVHYAWYYIYRPVGPDPAPELALDEDEIVELRRFIVESRSKWPIVVIDAYWDHKGRALCPAATGIAHHIGPGGDIEPCPPIQFAAEQVTTETPLSETLENSSFLARFRQVAAKNSRGCIILDNPRKLEELVGTPDIHDSSGRATGKRELAALTCRCSHHIPGREIPETNWMYRLAKKYWFFGFGAYG